MSKFEELLSSARWGAYRDGRHCHQRRRAFVSDAYKALKGWRWSARTRNGMTTVSLESPMIGLRIDGFDHRDLGWSGTEKALADCLERLTLEALLDVARATKDRLDCKPGR